MARHPGGFVFRGIESCVKKDKRVRWEKFEEGKGKKDEPALRKMIVRSDSSSSIAVLVQKSPAAPRRPSRSAK